MRLAIVDLETTGVDPDSHRVVEAAVGIYDTEHFGNTIGELRNAGLMIVSGDSFALTDKGLGAAGDVGPKLKSAEVIAMWMSALGLGPRTMLDVLVKSHPSAITRAELSKRSGYSLTSSHFGNCLGELRSSHLAVVEGQSVRANAGTLLLGGG